MWSESLKIWAKAINFYADNFISFIPIFPFLLLPYIGNILLSVIIKQKINHGNIFLSPALKESRHYLKTYISLSLHFAFIPIATAEIPILGEYFDVKYSRYVAMLPNVLVFEGIAIRTAYTIPALIFALLLIFWLICVITYRPFHPLMILIIAFIILMPLYGVVNTFLYLVLVEKHTQRNS